MQKRILYSTHTKSKKHEDHTKVISSQRSASDALKKQPVDSFMITKKKRELQMTLFTCKITYQGWTR